ncbi:hypothetical protein SMA679_0973 [Streptococcus macedonicus]|nr:hypothetical protein SMA679_0973 [Streptococcus macedonicus]
MTTVRQKDRCCLSMQATLVMAKSCFSPPDKTKTLCELIDTLKNDFWW